MRNFSLSVVVIAALFLCGLNSHAIAAATPPAVAPAITAAVQGADVVFTFPEGVDQTTISFKLKHHVITRHHLRHHCRWTSPTEMHVALHFFGKHSCCHPHEGLWVEGEAKGYVALLQFVVIENMPMSGHHGHHHHGHHRHGHHHHHACH